MCMMRCMRGMERYMRRLYEIWSPQCFARDLPSLRDIGVLCANDSLSDADFEQQLGALCEMRHEAVLGFAPDVLLPQSSGAAPAE